MDIIAGEGNTCSNRPLDVHIDSKKAGTADKELTLKFGSEVISISCHELEDIGSVRARLAEHVGLDLLSVKLVVKGKILRDNTPVQELWATGEQTKVALIGSKAADLLPSVPPPDIARVKDDLSDQAKATRRVKLKTSPGGFSLKTPYKFDRLEALAGFSDKHIAQKMLEELASDPAILHVLAKHKWSVGALCEMFPEGYVGVTDVCVMGLNQNHGEKILLRLRTDDLKGFRKILSIRKVLYHELAHNVYSDHDDDFYTLMRQIEREVNEADWTSNGRGRVLDNGYQRYQGPSTSASSNGGGVPHVYRLGGDEGLKQALRPAELAALAAERRLSPEEQEVEGGCGCSLHAHISKEIKYAEMVPIAEGSGHMSVCEEGSTLCDVPELGKRSDELTETPSAVATGDRTASPSNKDADQTKLDETSVVLPTRTLSPKLYGELCSRFLVTSNAVINNAVSFDQAQTLPSLEQLRDSLLTFLSQHNKGTVDSTMSSEICSEVCETMELIRLIITNAKVNSYSFLRYIQTSIMVI